MHKLFQGVNTAVLLFRQALAGREKRFTSGSINRSIALLAVPMVLELAMESLLVCASLFYVSRLGAGGVAIVGTTESIVTVTFSIGTGLTIAASALIARRVGAGSFKEAGCAAWQIVWVALCLGMVVSVFGGLFAGDILKIMGLSAALQEKGAGYSRIMFGGTWLLILRMAINGILRGAGNAVYTMRTLWLSNISNIILCPVFMFGWGPVPGYGITGLGIAVLLSRVIGILYQLFCITGKKTIISMDRSQARIKIPVIRKILRLTFGGTVQYIVPASSWLLLIKIISLLGTQPLAAYIIAQRISSITTLPAWGIGNAAGTLTGQNLGAGEPERAEKSVWRAGGINMLFLCVIGIGWIFLAGPVVNLFTTDESVKTQSIAYLHFISFAYILLGYTMVISRALNAAGRVKSVTLLYVVMFYGLQLPLAYMLGIHLQLGTNGIFTAILLIMKVKT